MAGRHSWWGKPREGHGLRPADMAFELVPGSPWKNWRMHSNGVLCIAAQSASSTRRLLHGGYASAACMQAGRQGIISAIAEMKEVTMIQAIPLRVAL